ncbi:MAG: PorT family protein [Lewinella sp.]|nr:PorT family protein [Lewinella sp.]
MDFLLLSTGWEPRGPSGLTAVFCRRLERRCEFTQRHFSFNSRQPNPQIFRSAPQASLCIRYFNRRSAGFIGELSYVQAGWSETLGEAALLYERQTTYVEAAMFSQFVIGRGRFRPMLQAGPYFAFPVADQEVFSNSATLPVGDTYFGRQLPQRLNYGLLVGGGLYVHLGLLALQFEGRYQSGLSDLIARGTNGISSSRRQAVGGRLTIWYRLR